jgi:hypothetical protein
MYEFANGTVRSAAPNAAALNCPDGVCATFALDYIRRKSTGQIVNESTYQDADTLNKISTRHTNYQVHGALESLAGMYDLHQATFKTLPHDKFADGDEWPDKEYLNAAGPGRYYVAFLFQGDNGRQRAGHAICLNTTEREVADSNAGIVQFDEAHFNWLDIRTTIETRFREQYPNMQLCCIQVSQYKYEEADYGGISELFDGAP